MDMENLHSLCEFDLLYRQFYLIYGKRTGPTSRLLRRVSKQTGFRDLGEVTSGKGLQLLRHPSVKLFVIGSKKAMSLSGSRLTTCLTVVLHEAEIFSPASASPCVMTSAVRLSKADSCPFGVSFSTAVIEGISVQ